VIRDIAARAGVSAMTVSRVLNGKPDVAPGTRDTVLRYARQLGYQGSHRLHVRATRRTGLIGLTIPFVRGEGDYYAEIVSGAADALYERDARIVLCPTRHEHDREVSLLERLLQHGATDGAILIAPAESELELVALQAQAFPFVVIDPISALGDNIPTISATNTFGGRVAVEHLIAFGHQRIAAITGPDHWPASVDRLAGYLAALAGAGLPINPDYIAEGDFTVNGGAAAAERLLSLRRPPTALFCFNDMMAIGAMRAAAQRHIIIPDALSIVGFDDIETASLLTPTLTTVRQPLQAMGHAAVDLLYSQIEQRANSAARIEIATTLITRASSVKPLA
jgi:LacI family transcriptional regulator